MAIVDTLLYLSHGRHESFWSIWCDQSGLPTNQFDTATKSCHSSAFFFRYILQLLLIVLTPRRLIFNYNNNVSTPLVTLLGLCEKRDFHNCCHHNIVTTGRL